MKFKLITIGIVLLILGFLVIPCFNSQLIESEIAKESSNMIIFKERNTINNVRFDGVAKLNSYGIVVGRTYLLNNWRVYLLPLVPIFVNGVMKSISSPIFAFFLIFLPLDSTYNFTAIKTGYYSNIEVVELSKQKRCVFIYLNLRENSQIIQNIPKNI